MSNQFNKPNEPQQINHQFQQSNSQIQPDVLNQNQIHPQQEQIYGSSLVDQSAIGQQEQIVARQSNPPIDRISQIGAQINKNQRQSTNLGGDVQPQQTLIMGQQPTGPSPMPQAPPMNPGQLIGGTTSEAHVSSLKDSFIHSANTLTAFYKQSCNAFNLAYHQGKQDAYEDVFSWFMSQGQNGSFKHISVSQFQQFITGRLGSSENDVGGLSSQIEKQNEQNQRNLMPPPDTRFGQRDQGAKNQPSSQDLILMTANQCIKETQSDPSKPNIIKKINSTTFQNLKFTDNKKRIRQTNNCGQEYNDCQLDERDQMEQQQQNMFYQNNESDMDMTSTPSDSKSHLQIESQMGTVSNLQNSGNFGQNQPHQINQFQNQYQQQNDRDFQRIKRRNIQHNTAHSPPQEAPKQQQVEQQYDQNQQQHQQTYQQQQNGEQDDQMRLQQQNQTYESGFMGQNKE